MNRSPLTFGLIYIAFGIILVTMSAFTVSGTGEMSFITYLVAIFAAFDIGSGIKLIYFHFKTNKKSK